MFLDSHAIVSYKGGWNAVQGLKEVITALPEYHEEFNPDETKVLLQKLYKAPSEQINEILSSIKNLDQIIIKGEETTLLHWAIVNKLYNVANNLLERGASVHSTNKKNGRPYMLHVR